MELLFLICGKRQDLFGNWNLFWSRETLSIASRDQLDCCTENCFSLLGPLIPAKYFAKNWGNLNERVTL